MKPFNIIMGFLPLIVFSVLSKRLAADGVAWSGLIAVAINVVEVAVSRPRLPPKPLSIISGLIFIGISLTGFIGGRGVDEWLFDWAVPSVGLLIGAFALLTSRTMPFTAYYARAVVSKEYWSSPLFLRVNRTLSAWWGASIAVLGVCSVAVAVLDRSPLDGTDPRYLDLVLNWVVPILIIWLMIRFTMTYPDKVRSQSSFPPESMDSVTASD